MTRPHLDVRALRTALDQHRRARKLSWRQVASEAGVSPSTISRMTQDKRPDVDSFAALVSWMGVPADTFLVASQGESIGAQQAHAVLSTHLRAGKNLSPEAAEAIQDLLGAVQRLMDSGTSTPGDEDGH